MQTCARRQQFTPVEPKIQLEVHTSEVSEAVARTCPCQRVTNPVFDATFHFRLSPGALVTVSLIQVKFRNNTLASATFIPSEWPLPLQTFMDLQPCNSLGSQVQGAPVIELLISRYDEMVSPIMDIMAGQACAPPPADTIEGQIVEIVEPDSELVMEVHGPGSTVATYSGSKGEGGEASTFFTCII